MNSISIYYSDSIDRPFQVDLYTFLKSVYKLLVDIVGRAIVGLVLIITSPLWCSVLFLLLWISNNQLKKALATFRDENQNAPKSKDLFNFYKATLLFKGVFEIKGEYHMPKRFKILHPFFLQFKKFHRLQAEHAQWLEEKLYPTFSELSIPPEDVEFLRKQMTYDDLQDQIEWVDFESEILLS